MTGIIVLETGLAPATPSTGNVAVYSKTDNKLYWKDSAGTETEAGGVTNIKDLTGVVENVPNANMCIGYVSGASITSGTSNTALGVAALNSQNIGAACIAIGDNALGVCVAPGGNIAVGSNAGNQITSGSENVIIGNGSGNSCVTGIGNIILGSNTNIVGAGAINQILIGASCPSRGDNTIQMGQSATTTMYVGTTNGALQTGDTTNTTAVPWKFGDAVTAATTPDTTQYLEVMVNGTLRKLVIAV